jgi:hypothetical protein
MATCNSCGHQHAGPQLANICIGCPCPREALTPEHCAGCLSLPHARGCVCSCAACRAALAPAGKEGA